MFGSDFISFFSIMRMHRFHAAFHSVRFIIILFVYLHISRVHRLEKISWKTPLDFFNFFNDSPNLLRRHYSITVISGTLAKITKHSGSNVTASNIKVVLLLLRCSELKGGCSRLSGDLSSRISALFRSRVSFAIRVLGSSSFRGGQESTL